MNILFLDIDGVLNHGGTKSHATDDPIHQYLPHGFTTLDPLCVKQLDRIYRKVDCKVVLSSTWRLSEFGVQNTEKALRHYGFTGKLYDGTPRLGGQSRGNEIQAWLNENKFLDYKIVIVDDDMDMAHLLPRLVITNHLEGGLTEEKANQIITKFESANV